MTGILCKCTAHDINVAHTHPRIHPHPPGPRKPPHTHGGINGQHHSHGPPSLSHSHGPGLKSHSHGPNTNHAHNAAVRRTRYVISNLWNGSLDTVSQAQDKGGNQVVVTLEGINLQLIYRKRIFITHIFLLMK